MPLFIDSHEDLAYNMLVFQRDYRRSVADIRQSELGSDIPEIAGESILGWPEYQMAQTAVIFGTLFILPKKEEQPAGLQTGTYHSSAEARTLWQQEIDLYLRLEEQNPEQYKVIRTQTDLQEVINPWRESPAEYPKTTHPIGLVILMEGAEGILAPKDMLHWWEQGVRIVGPVWNGGRFCGSGSQPGGFTSEGLELLKVMAETGMTLDISHMDMQSALVALERFEGNVIASHANCRQLLPGFPSERHFSDETIRVLIERDGVMGVIPFNYFLNAEWKKGDDRRSITMNHLANHIDHICQIAGNTHHAAIGTDFEGGFGLADIPFEFNSISDIQLLSRCLAERGYHKEDIDAIFYGNWLRTLERILP
jgi:membrane dipeptidase